MFFVDTIEIEGLGNRHYLAGEPGPPWRSIRRVTSTR